MFLQIRLRHRCRSMASVLSIFLITITAVFTLITVPHTQAGGSCGDGPWVANNEFDLNYAITCANSRTTPRHYYISLGQDINLTASSTTFSNGDSEVIIHVEGNNHTVNGQNIAGLRPFTIAANTSIIFDGITIIGGNVQNSDGGAIANAGTLAIWYSTILSNSTNSNGGGIYNNGQLTIGNSTISSNPTNGNGGGIYNDGQLTIESSTISSNPTSGNGGGIYNNDYLFIQYSTIASNSTSGNGGGIYNNDHLVIQNSTTSGNSAVGNGGGIAHYGTSATMKHVTIANNSATLNGDAVFAAAGKVIDTVHSIIASNNKGDNCSATINSFGSNISSDNSCNLNTPGDMNNVDPLLRPLADNYGPTWTHALMPASPAIDAADFVGSLSYDQRGIRRPQGATYDIGSFEVDCAPYQTTLVNTVFELFSAIGCYNAATVAGNYTIFLENNINLVSSTPAINNANANIHLIVEGEKHTVNGQGILGIRPFTINANTHTTFKNIIITGGKVSDDGGGITNAGTLTLNNSTVSNNTAANRGGGIFNTGTLTVNNNTLSGNSATNHGGGIYNNSQLTANNNTLSGNLATNNGGGIFNATTATLDSITFFGNSATGNGGGIFNSGTITVGNSIIANSTNGNNCSGPITSTGYNLASDNSCNLNSTGDKNNTNPLLGPLADNEGPTWTHALLPGSPAINAGKTNLPFDQRGMARPSNNKDDIGAFESYECTLQPWVVASAKQLDSAIGCYNAITVAGNYTISIIQNINLSVSSTPINNVTSGVTLRIEGNNHSIDGRNFSGVQARAFHFAANTTATLQNLTIRNTRANIGAGIYNSGVLTVNNSILHDNETDSGKGGGIYNNNGGVLTLNNSTIAENDGGAILNDGIFTLNNSTISNHDHSVIQNNNGGTFISNNSTIAENEGGGILNSGTFTISNNTIADNGIYSGAFGISNIGTLTINNSIITNWNGNDNCEGVITSTGYNIADDDTCSLNSSGDMSDTYPGVIILSDNGGPTKTNALSPDSPAIDAGSTNLTTDQRGRPRPTGAGDDIGAFEVSYPVYLPVIIK